MDSAEAVETADTVKATQRHQSALASRGALLGEHDLSIRTLTSAQQGTSEQIAHLSDQVTALLQLVSASQSST